APAIGAAPSKGMLVHLPEAALAAMQAQADKRGEPLHAVAEQAWRIARGRVQAAARIEELVADAGAGAYRGGGRNGPQVLALSAGTEGEIQREAARLDTTVSQVFAAAWHVAHDVMRFTSSLLR